MSPELRLVEFWEQNKELAHPFTWLRGRGLSDAFVICIGAGPWKFGRRKEIQKRALKTLYHRDIITLTPSEIYYMYPLQWQRDFVEHAVIKLNQSNTRFRDFCRRLIGRPDRSALQSMRDLVDTKEAKVISLFCRDALFVPSFPIDRHVRRKLVELGLPTKEDAMIRLCDEVGINPRKAAVAFVRAASDMDNPDWSIG